MRQANKRQQWEAILPYARRGNKFAKSLYLDNHNFARTGRSRAEALERIEQCQDQDQFIRLLQPYWPTGQGEEENRQYGFNFLNTDDGGIGTIEFRRGSWSKCQDYKNRVGTWRCF